MKPAPRSLAAAALALAASCASYSSLRFQPTIQDVLLRDDAAARVHLTVAWRGIERQGRADADPHRLVFRVRIENLSDTPLVLAASEFTLIDAALVPFAGPQLEGWPESLAPGTEATATLRFGVPPGKTLAAYDLSALNLGARFQGGRWSWSTTFDQVPWREPYDDPYWSSSWRFRFGATWCD